MSLVGTLLFRERFDRDRSHLPRREGGTDALSNLVALHRHCHDQRHTKKYAWDTPDTSHLTEEPDEGKALMSGFEGGQEGVIPLA